jgi:hypothetical protein
MTSRLISRVERLEPIKPRAPMVLYREDCESDESVAARARTLGAVAIMPGPHRTTVEEWVEACRRSGYPAGWSK